MNQFALRFDESKEEMPSFYMMDSLDEKMEFETDKDTYYYQGKIRPGKLRIFVEGLQEDKDCFYLLKDGNTRSSFKIIHPYEVEIDGEEILYLIDDRTELRYVADEDSEKILMVRIEERKQGMVLELQIVDYSDNYFANKNGFLSSLSPDQFRNRKNVTQKKENGFLTDAVEKPKDEVSSLQRSYLDSMIRENRK